MNSILVVDDDEGIRQALKLIFDSDKYDSFYASTGRAGIDFLQKNEIDLMFLDLKLPDMSGLEVLKIAKSMNADLAVIIMTGYADVETAVEAMKNGAYDYLKKPLKSDAIRLVTKLIFQTQVLKKEVNHLREKNGQDPFEFILVSQQLKNIFSRIKEVVKHSHIPVLIQGETGTGKNMIAQVIHNIRGGPFLELNCSAIPESLLESELFGYEKGAFTGADKKKVGLFELADKGTLFLNEIGSMPLGLQSKILHVLDNLSFRRLGGKNEIPVNAQIIVATNRDLEFEVAEGRFRKDLYFRLNVYPIIIPPLRDRKNSISKLVHHFIIKHSWKFQEEPINISPHAMSNLYNYDWPGNVRELENIIERILISNPDLKTILPEHLPIEITKTKIGKLHTNTVSDDNPLDPLSEDSIRSTLLKARGNISKASRILNVPRSTLKYRIKILKI